MNETPDEKQEEELPAHVRHAPLAFASVWIIILTCTLTDLILLKKPVFLYTVIPIAVIVIFATLRMRAASRGDYE